MFVSRSTTAGFLLSGLGGWLGGCCWAGVMWSHLGKQEGWPRDMESLGSLGESGLADPERGSSRNRQPSWHGGSAVNLEMAGSGTFSPA